MTRRAFEIVAPGRGRIVDEPLPTPAAGELLVRSTSGAVSAGSEALVFSGRTGATSDAALSGADYPRRYGYTLVGEVTLAAAPESPSPRADAETGRQAAPLAAGARVFCFHPHATHAAVAREAVIAVPAAVPRGVESLYPNTETALTLAWDGAPRVGEAVVILGAGIVGILLAMVVGGAGAGLVVMIDPSAERRAWAIDALAGFSRVRVVADDMEARDALAAYPGAAVERTFPGFDLCYEISGNPAALDDAVALATFDGRVIVGSWYGERRHPVALDDRFHRARIAIRSSQVSTIAPELAGRMSRARRTAIVWDTMTRLPLERIPRRVIGLDDLPTTLAALADGRRLEPWIVIDYEGSTA